MSEEEREEKPFAVERAKSGRAKCKKCKCPIDKDTVRIAKLVANPFGEGKMKAWYHPTCLFEVFAKQRATTKRIDDPEEDVDGWEDLPDEDKCLLLRKLEEFEESAPFKTATPKARTTARKRKRSSPDRPAVPEAEPPRTGPAGTDEPEESPPRRRAPRRDDAFHEFQRICAEVARVDAYTDKTAVVRKMLTEGSGGGGFESDARLWCKLLLPGTEKRIYNLQSKQLIKLFARLLLEDEDEMLEHLERGDVAETIRESFEKSAAFAPASRSTLTIQEVDEFLEELSRLTREEEQIQHFRSILGRCTANDLKTIVRLIKHDLRINAGPKHMEFGLFPMDRQLLGIDLRARLNAIHEDAYRAFQTSRDLISVIERCLENSSIGSCPEKPSSKSSVGNKVTLSLMTPVLPMLAEACKSVEMAMKKCPNGMLSEVKYDGERVQVHKRGTEFRYFSRSLKPVLPHKVNLFKDYIPKAFPDCDDLILDAEVLMIDARTGQPLPFGSLGVHKKAEFKDANACLFVFDCIYYNGEVLLNTSMKRRRQILKDRMTEIPNRIMLSEVQEVNDPRDLAEMIGKVLKMGLEGLVLKDVNGKYEPGRRHWLKVKKDYLFGGAMADSADLVVLGAWYGTGSKGGMMSVFLMGCHDEERDLWLTVTKVHTGHDDATLARLQNELDMTKIGKDPDKLPAWLRANKPMIPDFVAKDPKKQPVWEVTGAEFTNQGVHTADGISIRFPRVTRIRSDKDWSTATSLKELRVLFEKRSESIDLSLLLPSGSGETKTDIEEVRAKPLAPLPGKRSKREEKPAVDAGDCERAGTSSSSKPLKREGKFTFIDSDDDPSASSSSSSTKESRRGQKSASASKKLDSAKEERSSVKSSGSTRGKRDVERGRTKDRSASREFKKECKLERQVRSAEEETSSDYEGERPAEFYAYVGNDYIEYTGDGSPINWIEGRKPTTGLPPTARPLSELTDAELSAKTVLGDLRVSFAHNFKGRRRKSAWRTLKTLGATILRGRDRSRSTHVVHDRTEIPSTEIEEFEDVPRTARHVSLSWLDEPMFRSTFPESEKHAVRLIADYCSCSCTQR